MTQERAEAPSRPLDGLGRPTRSRNAPAPADGLGRSLRSRPRAPLRSRLAALAARSAPAERRGWRRGGRLSPWAAHWSLALPARSRVAGHALPLPVSARFVVGWFAGGGLIATEKKPDRRRIEFSRSVVQLAGRFFCPFLVEKKPRYRIARPGVFSCLTA